MTYIKKEYANLVSTIALFMSIIINIIIRIIIINTIYIFIIIIIIIILFIIYTMSVGALQRLPEGLPRPPELPKNVVQYSPTAGLTGFGVSDCQVGCYV